MSQIQQHTIGEKILLNKISIYASKIMYADNKHDKEGDYLKKTGF